MKTSCSVTADARRPRGPRAVSLFGRSSPPGPSVLPWGVTLEDAEGRAQQLSVKWELAEPARMATPVDGALSGRARKASF